MLRPLTGRAPTTIGRFLILGVLDRDFAGVLLSAYDPDLDRKVALRPMGGASDDPGLGVARRLARLGHPNLLAVHQVFALDGREYVVMEHVEGPTLAAWLAERPRPWQEVLGVLRAAAAGLAAAHQGGVVHGDLGTGDVLVASDGRPRLAGFGRAAGTAADDQLAFCLLAWQALGGERASAEGRAPDWVSRVLSRGLETRPADRWPSMLALLAALRPRRRSIAVAVPVAAVLIAGVAAAAFVAGRERAVASEACGGARTRLAGIWDQERRAELHAAFAATGVPYAEEAFRGASRRLDDYARAWTSLYGETCRATRVEHRQPDAVLDLRMACLDRRRATLGAFTAAWARGMDARAVETALDATRGLPVLDDCADAASLGAQPPPGLATPIALARAAVGEADALRLARRHEEAAARIASARAAAEATGWPQVRAEAALAEARLLFERNEPGGEVRALDAARLATDAGEHRLAADALLVAASCHVTLQKKPADALFVANLAEGVLLRAGDDDRLRLRLMRVRGQALILDGKLDDAQAALLQARRRALALYGVHEPDSILTLAVLGQVASARGDYRESRRLRAQALADAELVFGDQHPQVGSILNNLGIAAQRSGDPAAGVAYYRRALAIHEKVFGADSHKAAITLENLGTLETDRGNLEVARPLLERALAITEAKFGKEHPQLGSTLVNVAVVYRRLGRTDASLALLERARAIETAAAGADHPRVAYSLALLCSTPANRGDARPGLPHCRRALEIRTRGLGEDHPLTVQSRHYLAWVLVTLGRCQEAAPLLERDLAALEKEREIAGVLLGDALGLVGRCQLAAGQAPAAVAVLERALASMAGHPAVVNRGAVRWHLARALWAAGRRADAVSAAQQALPELAADADGAPDLAAARAWLAGRSS